MSGIIESGKQGTSRRMGVQPQPLARSAGRGDTDVQPNGEGRPESPRGPFGGSNRVAGGMGDADDVLLERIQELLAMFDPEKTAEGSVAHNLRAALWQAESACVRGNTNLARYILALVEGKW